MSTVSVPVSTADDEGLPALQGLEASGGLSEPERPPGPRAPCACGPRGAPAHKGGRAPAAVSTTCLRRLPAGQVGPRRQLCGGIGPDHPRWGSGALVMFLQPHPECRPWPGAKAVEFPLPVAREGLLGYNMQSELFCKFGVREGGRQWGWRLKSSTPAAACLSSARPQVRLTINYSFA